MKKLSTAISFFAILMTGTANAYWQSNFLLGVSASYMNEDGDFNISAEQPTMDTQSVIGSLSHNSFAYGFLAGWQLRCNYMLYGIEVSADRETENAEVILPVRSSLLLPNGATVNANYNYGWTWGFTARVGYAYSRCFLPYVRIGAETSRDSMGVNVALPNLAQPFIDLDNKRTIWAFVAGIGAEFPLPVLEGTTFRVEYDYHTRGNAVEAAGTARDGITYIVADSRQVAHSAKASLVYNFI